MGRWLPALPVVNWKLMQFYQSMFRYDEGRFFYSATVLRYVCETCAYQVKGLETRLGIRDDEKQTIGKNLVAMTAAIHRRCNGKYCSVLYVILYTLPFI